MRKKAKHDAILIGTWPATGWISITAIPLPGQIHAGLEVF
jgi:hypothetical protein